MPTPARSATAAMEPRVGEKDLPGGAQDHAVVAGGLGPPPA
jgi:hypothetical protein